MSAQPNRLQSGGLIDRDRTVGFTFNGRALTGFAGDTLAAALLAAGIRLVGRSFKYHRPRGILSCGSEEPNALLELHGGPRCEANTRATVTELFEGLQARSQNHWPALHLDFGALASWLAPVFVAGFYYKTFMWPRRAWELLYEPLIRRAAGLGRASHAPDPDCYDKANLFCDLLVIGAGPAGLAAALVAGRSGLRVLLCDEDFLPGGRLNGESVGIDGMPGQEWARQAVEELRTLPEVRVLTRTTVFGTYDGGSWSGPAGTRRSFAALERIADHKPAAGRHEPRQRLWRIQARQAILASGATERALAFGGNDRPGVMLASAVRTFLHRYAVTPGRRVAVFTTSDDGWRSAVDLLHAGIEVPAIIDARASVEPRLARLLPAQTPIHQGAQVLDVHGARGVRSLTVRAADGRISQVAADALAISGGWNPNIALATHLGARGRWSEEHAAFLPGELPRGMSVAGAANGSYSTAAALAEGARSAAEAVRSLARQPASCPTWRAEEESTGIQALWHVPGSRGKVFVDFQHDVTAADVALAGREGFTSLEHLKRYTTLGMATDQGKTCALNGQALMAAQTGRALGELGMPGWRPPYTPVSIGALAGHHRGQHFRPTRYTAAHDWACERGATFVEAGEWLRAQWFATSSEHHWLQTVNREVRTVRHAAGVCDVSTLGKIDVQGADASAFLDRIYINTFSTLPVGRVRYGLMLREDGFVLDDGTVAHLADQHYVLTTTTVNAARVLQHLEHARQVLWPELQVQLEPVTEQWAQFAIAGPCSRAVLQRLLGAQLRLENHAFPHLACAELRWGGVCARVFRMSFSGELAYEIAVPAQYGDALIRAIMSAGEPLGLTPYGTEALGVMRIEKGHIAGNELNGTTTASDLGFARMMSSRKDYIGRVLAQRPALCDPHRLALVGVRPVELKARLHAGAHLVPPGVQPTLEHDQGYVTSVAFSPMLGHWIGLALLAQGCGRLGERLRAHDPVRNGDIDVEVVAPTFFDPEGARLRG